MVWLSPDVALYVFLLVSVCILLKRALFLLVFIAIKRVSCECAILRHVLHLPHHYPSPNDLSQDRPGVDPQPISHTPQDTGYSGSSRHEQHFKDTFMQSLITCAQCWFPQLLYHRCRLSCWKRQQSTSPVCHQQTGSHCGVTLVPASPASRGTAPTSSLLPRRQQLCLSLCQLPLPQPPLGPLLWDFSQVSGKPPHGFQGFL